MTTGRPIEEYGELWEMWQDAQIEADVSRRCFEAAKKEEKYPGELSHFAEEIKLSEQRADMLRTLLDCYEGITFCLLKNKHKYKEPPDICDEPEIEMTLNMNKEKEIYYQEVLPEVSKELSEWRKELAEEYEFEIPEDQITDADITQARQYPITNLLEFGQGNKRLCIWHEEKTPSLHYYPETNSVFCFGCEEAGDVIDVYRHIHSCSFTEAVRRLR